MIDNSKKETDWIEKLKEILDTFMNKANNDILNIIDTDIIQDGKEIAFQIEESISEAIQLFKVVQKIKEIPTILYMEKFKRYCMGLVEIPLEKRQKYLRILGEKRFNEECVFILDILNRIEEREKISLFLKLLEAKMDQIIDDVEYRRLMILTDRTLYSDLLYLKDNITNDPIRLSTASDYGLVSSGLLITAGNQWVEDMDDTDNGIRFNYTFAAKIMADIFFNVKCSMKPSNKGITYLSPVSTEKIEDMLNDLKK